MAKFDFLQNKSGRLFFIAVLFALMAGAGTILYLKSLEHRIEEKYTPAKEQKSRVVVASSNLKAGTVLSPSTVSVREIPSTYVPKEAVTAQQFSSISGAILTQDLGQGKMLTMAHIDLNLPKDLSATIKEGNRAITINSDELQSISGLLRPGNRIDIFSRLNSSTAGNANIDSQNSDVIIPVLEDVLVLATGKKPARPNEDDYLNLSQNQKKHTYNTITLELSPENSALLSLARSEGELIAVLRNKKDKGGLLFEKITLQDLAANSVKLENEAQKKLDNRLVDSVTQTANGKLLTKDGVVITDPNVHLNKDGLLVTKDGVVLSGRGLHVNADGKIVDEHGRPVDTASLVATKDGGIVDKNGNVLDSNGYHSVKGGFLADKDGNIYTSDGHLLKGVHLDKNGNVVTSDGRILKASDLSISSDGKVSIAPKVPGVHVGKNGELLNADGKPVTAADLVTVDKDGTVRTKDGRILKGVHMGKDGKLYDANGKEVKPEDLVSVGPDGSVRYKNAATPAVHVGKNGEILNADGTPASAGNLVTVGADGVVRTKDGKVLKGVHMGKDGKLYDANGKEMSAKDVLLAAHGYKAGKNGTVIGPDGKTYTANDLVTVDPDGTVRTKDGKILKGVYRDKNGVLHNSDGSLLTAQDVIAQGSSDDINNAQSDTLPGVSASYSPDLAASIKSQGEVTTRQLRQIEFIIGGSGDGAAKTFTVPVEEKSSQPLPGIKE